MKRMRRTLRGALRSKTIWFSFALVLLGAITDNNQYLEPLLSPDNFHKVMVVVGVISAVLRFMTDKPLDDK